MITFNMRKVLALCLLLMILSCSSNSTKKNNQEKAASSIKAENEYNDSLFQSVPKEFLVSNDVPNSETTIIKDGSIVFSCYSENEIETLRKESNNEEEQNTFYDDYAYYMNEASLFLYKKTNVKYISDKKYIQFILANGEKNQCGQI